MELMRLRFPGNWRVVANAFADVAPRSGEDGRLPRLFAETMLSLERRIGCYEPSSEPDYQVDLGWFPARDPNGKYRLTLRSNAPDEVLSELESADRFVIRDAIDRWMGQVHRARDRTQLVRWLEADLSGAWRHQETPMLVPLRVPAGWQIAIKNDFVDEDSPERYFLIEDVLWVQQIPANGKWEESDYSFDLGWYPDGDPTGQYRLVLMGRGGWDDILFEHRSADRFVIRDRMEHWMAAIERTPDRARLLALPTSG